jgi:enediyne polyketide synthase
VADQAPPETAMPSLAVVGLACRFPDADDAPELLDVVLAGRRAFRRIPPARLDLDEYYRTDPATSDATYSTRAALIEGWQFDCAAFGIEPAAHAAADPALWLALETTARALAGAGLTGGAGLNRDRTAVIIGNTLGGDTSRANALRVRWPYVRRVISDALAKELPEARARAVLRRAERQYLAPFPAIGPDAMAIGSAGTIAAAICSYFGFRGGSQAVDSAFSSSTQAVATACTALTSGEIDAAIAGGVDISLDPLELISLAKAGVLATGDVRIYDEEPAGFLPAEGCGVLLLMRTADARAADLPVYAEIVGWGASAVGHDEGTEVSSQLLAMQRAYQRAGVSPAEIHFFEGNGGCTSEDDDAELAALGVLRRGAQEPAVLGSVKANIGHAKAAAGAAGLIKTVLALSNGVLPPATGVRRAHPMITEGDARLTLPSEPAEWPEGVRLAAVSTLNSIGANVHLVLRAQPAGRPRADRSLRFRLPSARSLDAHDPVVPRLHTDPSEPVPFLFHAPDRFALAGVLTRLASVARWLSDAELQDLACSLARDSARQGRTRVAIVAAGQEELGTRAAEAAALLPELTEGLLSIQPGIFASEDADGRVGLLLSGADGAQAAPDELQSAVTDCLETLRWLESLEVHATAAVGHGVGALAGLAWAGVLGQSDVVEIAELRARFLHRAGAGEAEVADAAVAEAGAAEAGAADAGVAEAGVPAGPTRPDPSLVRHADAAALRAAIGQKYRFGPPRRRLISTLTGAEVGSVDDAVDLICTGFAGADHMSAAISAGAVGATLLLETGPGDALATAAATTPVPAVSLSAGFGDPADAARTVAALFAAGALGQPQPLFAGLTSRAIDIWRERTFIEGPCETRPQFKTVENAEPASTPAAASSAPPASADPAAQATPDETGPQPAPAGTDEQPAPASTVAKPTPAKKAPDPIPARATAAPGLASTKAKPAPASTVPQPTPAGTTAKPGPAGAATKAGAAVAAASASTSTSPEPATAAEADAAAILVPAARSASLADVRAEFERQPPAPAEDEHAGAGHWARCYAEVMNPAEPQDATAGEELTWRVHVSGSKSRLAAARSLFTPGRSAPRTVAVIGDPADEDARAVAVQTAREAIDTGEIVVVTTSPDFTGFFAGVQAEHPEIGVTVLRVPDEDGLRLAPEYARVRRGQFRELVLTPEGGASEPSLSELALAGGAPFPLGPEDVVLVSRSARGAGLALAQVLACCGTAVAVVGRPDEDDSTLVAGLEELRSAGARIAYEVIDLASAMSLAAAVQRIEGRLGPVTAIGHAVSPCDPAPLTDLTDIEISDHAANEAAALDRLVGSVGPGRLRMIITFGSVAARYGLPGGAMTALSSGAVATRAARVAAERNCRRLHVDIPAWAGAGLGDRPALAAGMAAAGTSLIDVGVASRLLLKVMTTADLPERIALHGRVSGPAFRPAPEAAAADVAAGLAEVEAAPAETVLTAAAPSEKAAPGAEATDADSAGLAEVEAAPAEADLPDVADTAVADTAADTAVAAAADTAAAETELAETTGAADAEIPVPASLTPTQLASAGLPDGGRFLQNVLVHHPGVELVCGPRLSLQADPYLADYQVDGLAMLPPMLALEALAQAASVLAGRPVRTAAGLRLDSPVVVPAGREAELRIRALRDGDTITAVLRCADSSFTVEHGRAEFSCAEPAEQSGLVAAPVAAQAVLSQLTSSPAELIDGAELYGSISFQTGRFRRVALLPEVTTRSSRALARGTDDEPWFEAGSPFAGTQFLHGSPGLADAGLQVLQACVPHLRLRVAGCASAVFSGREAEGAVEISARMVPPPPPPPPPMPMAQPAAAVPVARAGSGTVPSPEITPEERADQEVADSRPLSRRARRGQRQQAREQRPPAAAPATAPVPAQAGAPAREITASPAPPRTQYVRLADQRWDIEAADTAGHLLFSWRGVRVREAGPLPRTTAWPASLLAVYLERSACDLGLDASLRVAVRSGQPPAPGSALLAGAVPAQAPGWTARNGTSAREHSGTDQDRTCAAAAAGTGPLTGYSLAVTAGVPVACAWSAAEAGHRHDQSPGAIASVYAQLRNQLAEPPAMLAARLRVIGSCLAAAGQPAAGAGAAEAALTISSDGWVLLRSGSARVACTMVEVTGAPGQVAVAVLTGEAPTAAVPAPRRAAPGESAPGESAPGESASRGAAEIVMAATTAPKSAGSAGVASSVP